MPTLRPITTVADLIRIARNGRSQKEFAQELGVRQSSISRYECGKASPSIAVIEHCMQLVRIGNIELAPTADELAAKIKTSLSSGRHGQFRLLISKFIDSVTSKAQTTASALTTKEEKDGKTNTGR